MKQQVDCVETNSPEADVSQLDAAAPRASAAHAAITQLGPYRIGKQLGAGGMGVVYQAEDTRLLRQVALKVLTPSLAENELARKRFLREARAMAAVSHEGIVTVFQVDEDRGVPYLAMQLLEGQALDERIKQEKTAAGRAILPLGEILRIGREVAEGLAAAHARGLIHRDIKPSNIWLQSSGDPTAAAGRVKLLDFGLALEVQGNTRLTQLGSIPGTPAYMAPEQARGKPVDGRADLFSLGCVLYYLCTGNEPFKRTTPFDTMIAVSQEEPQAIREVNPQIPQSVAELVHQLLAKQPDKRPASAAVTSKTLKGISLQMRRSAVQSVPVSKPAANPRPTSLGNDRRKTQRFPAEQPNATATPRFRWVLPVSVVTGCAMLMAAGYFVNHRLRSNPATPAVVTEPAGEPEPADPLPSALAGPVDERWVKYVSELGPVMQARAVTRKLRELNPGFKGGVPVRAVRGVKPGTSGEVIYSHNGCGVSRLAFFSDDVKDITPLRALKDLKYLECSGTEPGKSQLADLAPLQGSYVTHLDCRNTRVQDLSPLRDVPLEHLWCDADLIKPQSSVLILLARGTLRSINEERANKVLSIPAQK